jgi:hypothetical protein
MTGIDQETRNSFQTVCHPCVHGQIHELKLRQLRNCPLKTVISISSNCFRDPLIGYLVNERRNIDNCMGVLARERCADLYQLGDECRYFSRRRMLAGQVRRGNEVGRKRKNALIDLSPV